jgi:hypothetical protein
MKGASPNIMWETCIGAVETVFQNDRTWQPFVMADHDAPLGLIPNRGVLHVFHGEDEDVFARFEKSASGGSIVFSCLHDIVLASALSNGKQQRICCSTKITINCDPLNKGQGGGVNITRYKHIAMCMYIIRNLV